MRFNLHEIAESRHSAMPSPRQEASAYLGGCRGRRSRHDRLVRDRDGQVSVIDERPGACDFARLELAVERDEVRVAEEAAVRHFGPPLVVARRVDAARRAGDGQRVQRQPVRPTVHPGGGFEAGRPLGRRGDRPLVRLVVMLLVLVLVALLPVVLLGGRWRRRDRRAARAHVRAVEVVVPVLHEGDGRVVGEVAAALAGRGSQAVRVVAQYRAEHGGRAAPDPASTGRLLELPRAVVHLATARLGRTAPRGCGRRNRNSLIISRPSLEQGERVFLPLLSSEIHCARVKLTTGEVRRAVDDSPPATTCCSGTRRAL